jgi:hypothetical protein
MGVESFALRYQDYRQKGTTLFRCRLPVEGIDAAALETNAHRVPPLFQHCKKSYSDEEGQVKCSRVMCFNYHRL